jgi:hypothetical protein
VHTGSTQVSCNGSSLETSQAAFIGFVSACQTTYRSSSASREEKQSLQTRDPAEAKRRHAEALVEIEGRWANLRAGPKALAGIEAHHMAAAIPARIFRHEMCS